MVTADGLLHHIEVTQEPSSGIFSVPMLNNQLISRRQLTPNVVCLDYHPGLSLIVLLGAVGISTSYPSDSGKNLAVIEKNMLLCFKWGI